MSDRNAQAHFNAIETPNVKRSTFPLLFHNIGTCNLGQIVPFLAYSDILPGDTFKCDTTAIIRMQTPLNPTMDGLIYDIYYFSVPHRIVWDHWKEFMGEIGDNAAWETTTQYTVPMINAPTSTGITKGTIADYMGLPKGITGISYQALPFRAYTSIYNCWFRNQNLIAPAALHTDDTTRNGDNSVAELGGACFTAGKTPDYFTTCLPAPQRALPGMTQGMTIPLGTSAPVYADTTSNNYTYGTTAVRVKTTSGAALSGDISLKAHIPSGGDGSYGNLWAGANAGAATDGGLYFSNLKTDLTQATAATINALRLAFQVQKLQELWARGGVRYFEILKNEFGTSPNMSVLQYPEYLGGTRDGIQLQEVLQNSNGSTSTDVLGYTGGMSKTLGQNNDFTKSFQEHCTLIGILILRQDGHLYQQSLAKMWTRENKLDYYTPILAHLGEQPVYKRELCCTGTSTDSQVFGYQERWAEYKYGRETTSGEMSSSYATSLDVWHYGDWYASTPTLAQNWFEETTENVDRTIVVKSTTADQFKFDIVTNIQATRPMPVYCTPGLIDHF